MSELKKGPIYEPFPLKIIQGEVNHVSTIARYIEGRSAARAYNEFERIESNVSNESLKAQMITTAAKLKGVGAIVAGSHRNSLDNFYIDLDKKRNAINTGINVPLTHYEAWVAYFQDNIIRCFAGEKMEVKANAGFRILKNMEVKGLYVAQNKTKPMLVDFAVPLHTPNIPEVFTYITHFASYGITADETKKLKDMIIQSARVLIADSLMDVFDENYGNDWLNTPTTDIVNQLMRDIPKELVSKKSYSEIRKIMTDNINVDKARHARDLALDPDLLNKLSSERLNEILPIIDNLDTQRVNYLRRSLKVKYYLNAIEYYAKSLTTTEGIHTDMHPGRLNNINAKQIVLMIREIKVICPFELTPDDISAFDEFEKEVAPYLNI